MIPRLRESTGAPALGTLMLGLCALAWLTPAAGYAKTVRSYAKTPPSYARTAAGFAKTAPAQTTPAAHLSSTPPLGGVNVLGIGPNPLREADRAIAQARALHAAVVRTDVPWSVLEPTGPNQPSPPVLAFADRLVSDAAADGIKVIMLVDSTPCWASSAPASPRRACVPGQSSNANAWPPSNPATYAAFVAFLAQRYGSRLAAIEVWNEPDQSNEDYFAGPEKPQRYAAILRAAYPAIKQASPGVQVLAGSLVGANGVFLKALYAAGIKGYYDGLAVHYYTLTLASLRSIHEVQVANGDTKPLWLDEFGWSSCWPQYRIQQEQACVTPRNQALNITNTYRSLARTPYVAAEVLYQLQGSTSENFGTFNENGSRKPAFAALRKVFSTPFGRVSPITLNLKRRGNHVLASGSAPVGDYMELEAFAGSTLRYHALFTLNRFNRFSIALPSVLGSSGLRVRVYQFWAGLSSAAQRTI
jgi:polysaccharide biosynthesis protein PslG